MAKKKSKQRKSNEVLRRPLTPEVSPKIDYHRPLSSPYEFPLVTIIIGSKQYGIPAHFLRNYQQFAVSFWSSTIIMPNVDEDVGHTVLHFLYTGDYETVNSPLDEGRSDLTREYKRSVLVYHAARNWGLTGLEILAKQKMQHLDEDVPILEILQVMRDVFSSLPTDETWLPDYIQGSLQRLLTPEDPGLGLHEFYNILGQDHQFDNAVMKMILEILSIRLCAMKDQRVKILNGTLSEESPIQGPAPEDPEPFPEEPESVTEYPEPEPEEPQPVPEYLEPVPEEPQPEEPQPFPEEPEPEPEPVIEYPAPVPEEPQPEEPQPFPEEPEPVTEYPEPEPVIEYPEPVPEKPQPVPKELSAEGDGEQWIIPQISAGTDDWSRASLSPGDTPNTEILQEAADQGHLARIAWSDLTLYENWGGLSSKSKTKRASKLRSRGLPVPSETGFISIVAT